MTNEVEGEIIESGGNGLSRVDWASMPRDIALMRMENDSIQSMAAARPRDHVAIRKNLLGQIEAYPAFAKEAIYNKPVGKDAQGVMQYARGLSIRAAEAMAEAYGYNRVSADVDIIDGTQVKITATFVDYCSGRMWRDSRIVSRFYKRRDGKTGSHSEDRFNDIVVPAAKSKLIREVILRSVPPGLRAELEDAISRKMGAVLDDATITKIVNQFATKEITLEMLESLLGQPRGAGWTNEHREKLLGVWNALKEGETSVAELFEGTVQSAGEEQQRPDEKPGQSKTEEMAAAAAAKKKPKTKGKPKKPKEEPKPEEEDVPALIAGYEADTVRLAAAVDADGLRGLKKAIITDGRLDDPDKGILVEAIDKKLAAGPPAKGKELFD